MEHDRISGAIYKSAWVVLVFCIVCPLLLQVLSEVFRFSHMSFLSLCLFSSCLSCLPLGSATFYIPSHLSGAICTNWCFIFNGLQVPLCPFSQMSRLHSSPVSGSAVIPQLATFKRLTSFFPSIIFLMHSLMSVSKAMFASIRCIRGSKCGSTIEQI